MTTPSRRYPLALLLGTAMVAAIALGSACAEKDSASGPEAAPDQEVAGADVDPRMYKSPEWLDIYRPESSFAGYNLVLYQRRVPMLIDMDGKVVRAWHGVRAVGRARLLPTGHVAVIGASGRLEEYDWDRQLTWSFELPDSETFLHHDFIQLENGRYLLLAHDPAAGADFLLEVDRSGEIVWQWSAREHLAEEFTEGDKPANKTHINSVHELPPNRWFDRGLEEFRPGNILISARNLNALYIIARPEGDVVWRFDDGLDYQHEAIMIAPGIQGAGNILLFNNGYHDLAGYRQSAITELNPVDKKRVWEYRKRGFFSSTGGTQQTLANGNLLVTSSQGGRVFELSRDGRIVWQWSPPYMPMRATRYAADYAPQLRDLGPPAGKPIDVRDPDSHIDWDLYTFSLPHETRRVRVDGESRFLLKDPNRCQELQIPSGAELQLGFGIRSNRKDPTMPFVRDSRPAHFSATMRALDTGHSAQLLDRIVELSELQATEKVSDLTIVQETISLRDFWSETVELCLQLTFQSGGDLPDEFVWEEPAILTPQGRSARDVDAALEAEALESQAKHLEAIGYIN